MVTRGSFRSDRAHRDTTVTHSRCVHRVVHNCARMYGSRHRTPRRFNVWAATLLPGTTVEPLSRRSTWPKPCRRNRAPSPQQKGHANKRGALPQDFGPGKYRERRDVALNDVPVNAVRYPDLVRSGHGAYPRKVSRLRRVPLACTQAPLRRGGQETKTCRGSEKPGDRP